MIDVQNRQSDPAIETITIRLWKRLRLSLLSSTLPTFTFILIPYVHSY